MITCYELNGKGIDCVVYPTMKKEWKPERKKKHSKETR